MHATKILVRRLQTDLALRLLGSERMIDSEVLEIDGVDVRYPCARSAGRLEQLSFGPGAQQKISLF